MPEKRTWADNEFRMETAHGSFAVQKSSERFFGDHGWLKTYHSFSFAEYHDPANVHWGALRVFNDDRVAPGSGFPTHPHANMEIVTYVLEGELEHRDSLGSHGIVAAGGVQYLSAGTGLRHSEYNASADHELHFVQMWVLPGEPDTKPTYGQVDFDPAARCNRWLSVASGETADSPIRLTQQATLRVARLENGAAVDYRFAPGRFGFLFVGAGQAQASATDAAGDEHSAALAAGDALRVRDVTTLKVSGAAELVFWDVPPIPA